MILMLESIEDDIMLRRSSCIHPDVVPTPSVSLVASSDYLPTTTASYHVTPHNKASAISDGPVSLLPEPTKPSLLFGAPMQHAQKQCCCCVSNIASQQCGGLISRTSAALIRGFTRPTIPSFKPRAVRNLLRGDPGLVCQVIGAQD